MEKMEKMEKYTNFNPLLWLNVILMGTHWEENSEIWVLLMFIGYMSH